GGGGVAGGYRVTAGVRAGEAHRMVGPSDRPATLRSGRGGARSFLRHDAGAAEAFHLNARGRWQCDLGTLARRRLDALGVTSVFGGGWCTYADAARFFSYRRDGQCGRMAALIWLG